MTSRRELGVGKVWLDMWVAVQNLHCEMEESLEQQRDLEGPWVQYPSHGGWMLQG